MSNISIREKAQVFVEGLIKEIQEAQPRKAFEYTRELKFSEYQYLLVTVNRDLYNARDEIIVQSLRHTQVDYKSVINTKKFYRTAKKDFDVAQIADHIEKWIEKHLELDSEHQKDLGIRKKLEAEVDRLSALGTPRFYISAENQLELHVDSLKTIKDIFLKTYGVTIDV